MATQHLHHVDLLAHRPPTWALALVLLPILVAFCATEAGGGGSDIVRADVARAAVTVAR